jgi:hypothetical protein
MVNNTRYNFEPSEDFSSSAASETRQQTIEQPAAAYIWRSYSLPPPRAVLLSAVFVVLSSCFGLISRAADEGESCEGSDYSDNEEKDVSLGCVDTADEVDEEERQRG